MLKRIERIRKGLCGDCGERPLAGKWCCIECRQKRNNRRAGKAEDEPVDLREVPRTDGNWKYMWA